MPVTQSRISDIAAQIRGACSTILDTQDEIYVRQDALNATRESNRGVRLQAMLTVAGLSAADKWFPREITEACKQASKGNQEDKSAKALATFISEMKNCADPNVRDQFPALVAAVESAWADETDMLSRDKDTPAPMHKCWARAYHAIAGLARYAKEHGGTYTTAKAVVAFAVAHDPDFDTAKVHKRLMSAVTMLQEMFRDFPHGEIETAADFLKLIKPEDLVKAREAFLASTATAAAVLVPNVEPVTTVVAEADTTETDEVEPAEGVIDVMDQVLGEVSGEMGAMAMAA